MFEGKKIATTYPNLLKEFFKKQGINFTPVLLKGSVEVAPRAGLADAICDIVSSGATLEANGLKEVYEVFKSKAVLIKGSNELNSNKKEITGSEVDLSKQKDKRNIEVTVSLDNFETAR